MLLFSSILRAFRVTGPKSTDIYPSGQNADLSCDSGGNLFVRMAMAQQSGVLTYQAVPAVATAVIYAAPVILSQFGGFNDSGAPIYVQLHNKAVALVLGDAPKVTFYVGAGASFSWDPSRGGREFTIGLAFGVSSTRDTYTPLATNIFCFAELQN